MSRDARESKGSGGRTLGSAAVATLVALFAVATALAAHAAEVDVPGAPTIEEGSGYVVPNHPLWVGGDLTIAGAVPQDGRHASLELDDINLLLRYEPLPRLSFFSETRLENTFSIVEGHGANVHSADVFVERLYADWIAAPHVTIRAGKFLTPFGVWNQIRRAPLTWTVERPLVTEETFPEHTTGVWHITETLRKVYVVMG